VSTTPVAIIGAGPAGLLLSQILYTHGVDNIVIEAQSRAEVESTVRAGILEQGTVKFLRKYGVAKRLDRVAEIDDFINYSIAGELVRVNLKEITGNSLAVYPQHEVLIDLIAQRLKDGGEIWLSTTVKEIKDHKTDHPTVVYTKADGTRGELTADYVVGADGSKSVARKLITADGGKRLKYEYPYAWLGIMVNAPQTDPPLIYATHPDGYALVSTRTASVQRYYVQCDPDDTIEDWPDERIWEAMHTRVDSDEVTVSDGEITSKTVLRFRSTVTDKLQSGRLFIAGDAAHTVPPTGAKGLNLAVADIAVLGPALARAIKKGDTELLDRYTEEVIPRIWQTQHFSYWMSSMLHSVDTGDQTADDFQTERRLAELRGVLGNPDGRKFQATQYVGLDMPDYEV